MLHSGTSKLQISVIAEKLCHFSLVTSPSNSLTHYGWIILCIKSRRNMLSSSWYHNAVIQHLWWLDKICKRRKLTKKLKMANFLPTEKRIMNYFTHLWIIMSPWSKFRGLTGGHGHGPLLWIDVLNLMATNQAVVFSLSGFFSVALPSCSWPHRWFVNTKSCYWT